MISTQEIIKSVYYDRSGYGSKQTTLKDAKQKDSSTTINDINEFFSINVEEKRKMRGENSFIAPHSFWECQVDMFFISKNDLDNQTFRIGMMCIDIFSKYMHIVPIKSKTPPDILAGMMENINKMGGKPKLIYTDEEGSFLNQSVLDYLKEEKIELHRTELKVIQHLRSVEFRLLKINCLNELKRTRKMESRISNGRIILLKYY